MKQKQEGACAVPDCKDIPSFGPILMPATRIPDDDLNVCGGSERLAATTIETLAQIGFNVDLATFTMPDLARFKGSLE